MVKARAVTWLRDEEAAFDFDHARGLKRDVIARTLDFIAGKDNVVFLGPPGTGKPTWPPASPSAPAKPATESCSPPPPNGSTGTPKPAPQACSKTNSAD